MPKAYVEHLHLGSMLVEPAGVIVDEAQALQDETIRSFDVLSLDPKEGKVSLVLKKGDEVDVVTMNTVAYRSNMKEMVNKYVKFATELLDDVELMLPYL